MPGNWDAFIAYSSKDRPYAARLAKALKKSVRVFFDQDALRPGDDWDEKIRSAIDSVSVVIALISPSSGAAFFQREELLRALDAARSTPPRQRLIPVFIDGATPGDRSLPYGLRPKHGITVRSFEEVDTIAPALIRLVLDDSGPDEGPTFSEGIASYLKTLHQDVQALTDEQYRVIQQLRQVRRVCISGCAGSGKTLVAAEKASRLAEAGLDVLFLCHNPLLCEHVRNLIAGSGAHCLDFVSWINEIAGRDTLGEAIGWTHFTEPSEDELHTALQALATRKGQYDAIVVDEAQDFREEWWVVVEAALRSPSEGFFYIFHDNNQSLLPRRGQYPVSSPQVDLSRNCRNAGRVFDLMRFFDQSSPDTDAKLKEKGHVTLRTFAPGDERVALAEQIREFARAGVLRDLVVLWSGPEHAADSPIAHLTIDTTEAFGWQDEVRKHFERAFAYVDHQRTSWIARPALGPSDALDQLSVELYPNVADIELVQAYARSFGMPSESAHRKKRLQNYSWTTLGGTCKLRRTVTGGTGAEAISPILRFFQRSDWHVGIPVPIVLGVIPFQERPSKPMQTIPLYGVGDFKGLEADAVILVMRGKTVGHRQSAYVGISRARAALSIVADADAVAVFPKGFEWTAANRP